MPVTLEQFVDSLSTSGLMTVEELKAFRDGVAARQPPPDSESLARELVREGRLTKFQARALYEGKAKGLVCGDYVLLDRIGAGGMGQVYKARHKRMNRIVALKLLIPRATTTVEKQRAVKRFYQEVELAARLMHPNIVVSYDAGESNGLHYLVMELVEGQDVSSLLKPDKKLPLDQALDIVLQAGRGLEYAHAQGVIHRDIKPSNLLMDKQGKVKILDMGLARAERDLAGGDPAEGLTGTGEIMGTVDYMPPEQSRNTREADARSDIYSLGCTLYRLLTGTVPFSGNSAVEKILAHGDRPIPMLGEHCPGVSPRLQRAFERMLAKKPEDRFPNMTAVIAELEACRANVPEEEHSPLVTDEEAYGSRERKPLKRNSPRVWMLAGGGLAALLLVGAIVALLSRGREPPTSPDDSPVAQVAPADREKPTSEPAAAPVEPTKSTASVIPTPTVPAPTTEPPTKAPEPVVTVPSPSVTPAAIPPEGIDLLKLVDLKRDDLDGTWRADGSSLACELPEGNTAGRLQLPYAPPAEYDLHVTAEMLSDESTLVIVLVVGSSRVGFAINPKLKVTGLAQLNGINYNHPDNPTTAHSAVRSLPGQPLTIVCQVRPTSVAIELDGRQVVDWKGDPKQLSVTGSSAGSDTTKLCAFGRNGVRLTNYELLPPGGQSRKIPPEGIDLLKLIDLKRDVGEGTWTRDGSALVVIDDGKSGRLQFSPTPPPEYDLHVEVETSESSSLTIGLPVGASQVGFVMSHSQTGTGLANINGKRHYMAENPTRQKSPFGFAVGQPMAVVCQVRPTSVLVTLNGRPVADWKGDPQELSVERAGTDKTKLFLFTSRGVRFTQYELLPPGGTPQPRPDEVAAAPAKSGVRVNLLPLIDVKRDAVKEGNWSFDGGVLLQAPSTPSQSHTLQIPVRVPAEYELRVVAEPVVSSGGALKVGLVAGPSRAAFTITRTTKTSGLEEIQGKKYSENETTVQRLPGLGPKAPMTIVCTVRGTGIRVLLNGQQVVDWKGDFKQLAFRATGGSSVPSDKSKLFLLAAGGDAAGSFRFTKLELVPLGAKPVPVPPTPAIAAALLTVQGLVGDLPKDASALQRTDAARRLHERAASTDDNALRYTSLTEAVKLAAAGDDFRLLLDLVEDLQRCFEVDGTSILNLSLNEIASRTRPPNDRKELIVKVLETATDEMVAERYDIAGPLMKLAATLAAKQTDAELKKEVHNRELESEGWQKLFVVAEPARQTLAESPEDSAANLAVGTYLAVARGNWSAALPHLTKADDATIHTAAQLEIQDGNDPAKAADIAAAWIEAADKAPLAVKAVYFEHARQRFIDGATSTKSIATSKMLSRFKKVEGEVLRTAGSAFVKRHPLGAIAYGGHWYRFIDEPLPWEQARDRCRELGGYLVCIETPTENQWLYQFAAAQPTPPSSYYIGCTDAGHPGRFMWVNGTPVQFTDWANGNPVLTPTGGVPCRVTLRGNPKWYNLPTQIDGFICEWDR